jgi:hypothetical protein
VIESGPGTEALWLDTMQQICSRAAHEVKGALNGVSVNLEVVRSRAEKPDAPASNVAKFANAASEQLETVIAMTVALLWISRPIHQPVELARVVSHLDVLLAPAAKADGRRLAADGAFGQLGTTSADGEAVRLAIGGCLLAATDASADVQYRAVTQEAGPVIRIESCDGAALSVGQKIVAAVASAGIHIGAEPAALFISFPR